MIERITRGIGMNALDAMIKLSQASEVIDLFDLIDEVALGENPGILNFILSNMTGKSVVATMFDDGDSSGFTLKLTDGPTKRVITFNFSEVEMINNECIDEINHDDMSLVIFNDAASEIPHEPKEIEFHSVFATAFASLITRVTNHKF